MYGQKIRHLRQFHREIINANLAAIIPYSLAVLHYYFFVSHGLFPRGLKTLYFIGLGALYTHFFEWLHHKFPMHTPISILGWKPLEPVRKSHMEHHSDFPDGEGGYQTRDRKKLGHITTEWYIFVFLFPIHYILFLLLAKPDWIPYTIPIFTGITFHFLTYENTHYSSHLKDSWLDRKIKKIWIIGKVRNWQDKHHRKHHSKPDSRYNFVPPFLGDALYWVYRKIRNRQSFRFTSRG